MARASFDEQIAKCVEAVKLKRRGELYWLGDFWIASTRFPRRGRSEEGRRRDACDRLTTWLYQYFFCLGGVGQPSADPRPRSAARATSFTARLSEANRSTGRWVEGWQVVSIEGATAVIESREYRATTDLDGLRSIGATSIAPGVKVAARFPKESARISPGFYVAFGNRDLVSELLPPIGRFYFNVSSNHAPDLLRHLTRLLNDRSLPFRFKVLSDPASYSRNDSSVLYVTNDAVRTVNSLLRETYHDIAPFLRVSLPALTKWLAPGVGAALDPGDGESFGTHRCKKLANHIVTSLLDGVGGATNRVSFVVERLEADGIPVAKPYLHAGYNDPFRAIAAPPRTLRSQAVDATRQPDRMQTDSFREMAIKIGLRLSQTAYWCGESCNWVADKNPWATARTGGLHPVTYEALGVDIYGGTSGIALFLAQLAKLSSIEVVSRAARGAMINSLARVKSCLTAGSTGLYTGWPGVLLAGAYVGAVLRDPLIVNETLELWSYYRQHIGEGLEFDLLSGDAGAIVALLCLDNLHSGVGALEMAAAYGDLLVRRQCETQLGNAWRSTTVLSAWPLTGFSHGASGACYALLELYRRTHDGRYLSSAMDGFAYERAWYSERHGNWADLRYSPSTHLPGKHSSTYSSVWCHGAPGVVLSRIRALEIVDQSDLRNDAISAMKTTCAELQRSVDIGARSLCLCHGLAGNADVIMHGEATLARGWGDRVALARQAARQGVANGGGVLGEWVDDMCEQQNPSLMLGLAGVGYFYLRMAEPTTPSVLLFGPEFVA